MDGVQMSVTAIGAIGGASSAGYRPLAVQNLDAVATALGISVIDLKIQLQSGKSLASVIASHSSGHHPHAGGAQGVQGISGTQNGQLPAGADKDGDGDGR